jgi:DNA-damage-inducible protein J
MTTQMVHARVDVNIKQEAERIFEILGINTSDAIRIFLTQVTIQQALPFKLRVLNEQTGLSTAEAKLKHQVFSSY